MTTASPPTPPVRTFSGLGRRIDAFIVAVALLAVGYTALVAYFEYSRGFGVHDRVLFAIVSAVLLITEIKSTKLLRATGGIVTPSWAFSFTLMLLGSPTGAIAVIFVATLAADIMAGQPPPKIIFNVSQIVLSLALGALVFVALGIHGPLLDGASLPADRALAMIAAGVVVFSANGIIVCRLLSWIEDTKFWELMRGTFLLSMTSDAAMLAIAPIFLITAKHSLLMLPLMGTATFFVYQTAQNALRRTHEANHDPLTQLQNRRSFNATVAEYLASMPSTEIEASVLLLDLDRFKEVNDRLGHQTGDHVLQRFADRLIESLPADAAVARLGGDEFAVLVFGPSQHDREISVARLHSQLAEPLEVDGFPITAGTSIGVAHAPAHGNTPSDLLHAADVAMYRAKTYRNGVEVYASSGATNDKGRVTLLSDVAEALDRNQFTLEYQPQVDISTRRIVSVEALLRWEHPVHGRIAPQEFIMLAEHTDLIGPITQFVIEQALRDIGSLDGDIGVSVNVSSRNLEDRHFAEQVLAPLRASGIDPRRLELEITESALAHDPEHSRVVLDQIRAAGVRIAIDDFGTGYSSFGTLREISIDRIKIDQSFIRLAGESLADVQIIKALIELAHGLGFDVVAEGVETHTAWKMLSGLNCDLAQGFLLSRSVPLASLAVLLDQRFLDEEDTSFTHALAVLT